MNPITKHTKNIIRGLNSWSSSRFLGIAVFNLILIFLFLLYSAGYFRPYFPITVNIIVLIGLVASIFLLGARSRSILVLCLAFFIFAGFLKIVRVDVWAERTTIYTYQSLIIGILLLILENIGIMKEG